MSDDTILPFGFPTIDRKKLIAAFDGGRITSDGGVLLLGVVERRLGIATRLAGLIADPRNPAFVTHSVADILRAHPRHCLWLRRCRRPRPSAHRCCLQAGLQPPARQ